MRRHWLLGALLAASLFAPAAAQAADTTILIGINDEKTLTPPSVSVFRGETVTWTYAPTSQRDHHIVSDLQSGPDTWDFGQTAVGTFPVTFTTLGTHPYHCVLHDVEMRGVITVANHLPTAAIVPSTTTAANGASVTFNAGTSADSDSPGSLTYAWDLDGDGLFETAGGTTSTISRSFTTAGTATVGVRVTDSDGGAAEQFTQVDVAAAPDPGPGPGPGPEPQPQPQPEPQPAAPDPTPAITAPVVVPIALAANPAPAAAAAPTLTAPKGQKLKRQKGVRVAVSCPGGCALVLNGTVKVGGKKLKLKKVSRSLAAGGSATVTLLVADAKALKKAKGKAQASITAGLTVAGQSSTKNVAVSLTS